MVALGGEVVLFFIQRLIASGRNSGAFYVLRTCVFFSRLVVDFLFSRPIWPDNNSVARNWYVLSTERREENGLAINRYQRKFNSIDSRKPLIDTRADKIAISARIVLHISVGALKLIKKSP